MYENQDHVYPALIKKVLPLWMAGFFAAVVMGAVLSTFNSVLNSAATIFSLDVYKRHINKEAGEKRLVWIGRLTSSILAIFAIISAPLVAGAPEGLYQLLQQLNGIFFIPIASIMLAGFFIKKISAAGAKSALVFGLLFYIFTTFIFKVDIHFIHLWGIEFVLNIFLMLLVSHFYPGRSTDFSTDIPKISMQGWRYTPHLSAVLVVTTVLIYIMLGRT
jgi:SSS family solute:Na+ symporter